MVRADVRPVPVVHVRAVPEWECADRVVVRDFVRAVRDVRWARRGRGPRPLNPGRGPKRMKIVVVSGRSEDETAAFVRRLGADAYLTKPFWSEQILATVREVLKH